MRYIPHVFLSSGSIGDVEINDTSVFCLVGFGFIFYIYVEYWHSMEWTHLLNRMNVTNLVSGFMLEAERKISIQLNQNQTNNVAEMINFSHS